MPKNDLSQALQQIHAKNIPLPPQRYALLEYLYAQDGYATVKDICEALIERYPHLQATTVYSSLLVFKRLGLVRELAWNNASPRYEAAICS
ncbi:Fur family transcriptional regulator [Paenibacillus aestuarii]|uniref:Fur family transcriptional regulator n=1 Tax=Paenibacillus aestuarii TaxID=516965 RepID=A0ABW0KFJ9_9BACL|nr:transcriptional repressor [Paenibacillus aestuarii]